jgi:uncharacterized YccA/Bax inhibitor family protein
MFRSSNPAINPALFGQARSFGVGESMTVQGTVNKCFVLLGLIVVSASWIWSKLMEPAPLITEGYAPSSGGVNVGLYVMGGAIGGFVLYLITVFNLPLARFTAPAYALCEGVVLGAISALLEQSYPGIVVQAVSLTLGTLFCMLMVYKSGLIQVNQKFLIGIVSATGAVAFVYFASWIMGFLGMSVSFIHGNSAFGIGFSVIVVAIAAFNLIVDFYFIEQGAEQGAARHMEWYGAMAMMVTLIWLYIEILRLLAKLRSRR